MTDPTEHSPAESDSAGEAALVLVLPERPTLDPLSAATLRVMEELDGQLVDSPDAPSVVLDPGRLAQAALEAVDGLPRVPEWVEKRTIGGTRPVGSLAQEPQVSVDVESGRPREIALTVQGDTGLDNHTGIGDYTAFEQTTYVDPADAEQWFLAGLAACRAARQADQQEPPDGA